MKSTIFQNGTLTNASDLQQDGSSLSGFTGFDPGIAPVPTPLPVTGIIPPPDASVAPAATAQPSPTPLTSAALISRGTVFGTSPDFAPLVITPVFGASITNKVSSVPDPATAAQIETNINDAISYYEDNWTSDVLVGTTVNGTIVNTVSVTIQFDYGTLNGTAMTSDSGASDSSPAGFFDLGAFSDIQTNYSSVLPNLPATDPTGGGEFFAPEAQSDMLGFTTTGTTTVGYVGLNSDANLALDGAALDFNYLGPTSTLAPIGQVGVVGAMEHEISEVFGRISLLDGSTLNGGPPGYSLLDLYRFTAPGTFALTASDVPAYFSIDNGTITSGPTAWFNDNLLNGGDAHDWASAAPDASPGTTPILDDAFDAFLQTGTSGTISNLDSLVLANIGFHTVCYMEGTRILTAQGEKRIETLEIGDELPTLLGGSGRVIWLGRREIDLTRHPRPWQAWPVRVRAGAFGPGLPARDLYVSPDHAIYTDGVLIPARQLINGSSIHQVKRARVVYHHVELEQHDVIHAEGLPCESYLDAGDRDTFAGGPVRALYPEFSAGRWEMAGCAPLVMAGARLEAVRARLAERAEPADDGVWPVVAVGL
jgi:hypothetical protein